MKWMMNCGNCGAYSRESGNSTRCNACHNSSVMLSPSISLRTGFAKTSLITSAPMRNHDYWVYILTNKHWTTLYIGITNNITRRLHQHRYGEVDGFAKRYHLTRLVWLEHFLNVNDAIACEKKLKGWRR